MRGADAFFDRVSAEDFSQASQEIGMLLGFAEFWAESTWDKSMPEMRDVEQEKAANSLEERDLIEVKRCSSDVGEGGEHRPIKHVSSVDHNELRMNR